MSSALKKIPLAFFAYNRPKHTERALNALAACERREDFEFYFFSDGPRNAETEAGVAEVRQTLKANAERFSAEIILRPANLGLARSIVDGVGRLCESHGRVVVLEDDLVVSPDFLHFMASALDHYADVSQVMQVGAYTIAPPENLETDAFLLPVTTTWGWGTWKRAWENFSWTPEGWPASRNDKTWMSLFEINGAGKYVSMLEDRLAGRNDSWGILWWYAISRKNGEVVYPAQTLVSNEGFDGSGVHCAAGTAFGKNNTALTRGKLPNALSFPKRLQHRSRDFEMLEKALRSQYGAPARVNSRALYLLKRIYKSILNAFN